MLKRRTGLVFAYFASQNRQKHEQSRIALRISAGLSVTPHPRTPDLAFAVTFFRAALVPAKINCGLLTQPEANPGLAWWRDRAVRRKSTSGASTTTTGPVSRRATSVPSHRADEPPGP